MAAFASAPRSPAWRLREHKSFGKVWPGVLEAVNLIGSKQVQGRASAGGNLCNGSPAGDSVPAMVAAGAIVTVQGPDGRREIEGGGRARRSRPHQPEARRDPRQLHPAAAPARLERCLSAHDPAHRNGHRRRRRRRQPDDQGRHRHRRPRRPRRRRADRAAGRRRRQGADRLKARRRRAGESSRRLFRRLPSDRRQARHHRLPHQSGRRAAQAHRRDRRPTRYREDRASWPKFTSPRPSTASRWNFCASHQTPCSTRCAGRWRSPAPRKAAPPAIAAPARSRSTIA